MNALAGLRKMEEIEQKEEIIEENDISNASDNIKEDEDVKEQEPVTTSETETQDSKTELPPAPGTDDDLVASLSSVSKPLKSILKKRKPEECPVSSEKGDVDKDEKEDVFIEKPTFVGGSIAEALRKIKEIKPTSKKNMSNVEDSKLIDDNEPKPSAFILEMEKEKEKLALLPQGLPSYPTTTNMPNMDWEGKETKVGIVQNSSFAASYTIAKPPELIKTGKQVTTKASQDNDEDIESVVLMSNIPFKVTISELVLILGIWPKGGYNGVKIIKDRMTGLEMKGRKLKVSKSCREELISDWIITKKANAMINHSRVIKVSNLGFHLRKSELLDAIQEVKFSSNDIYWKALKSGQSNSGRGYVVLESSDDAKLVSGKSYQVQGRKIEVAQVHPVEMKRFLEQCSLKVEEYHILNDSFDEKEYDNSDDLQLSPEKATSEVVQDKNDNSFVVVDEVGEITKQVPAKKRKVQPDVKEKGRNMPQLPQPTRYSRERDHHVGAQSPRHNLPPFRPTVHVRMYDVPDKATTADVKSFFEPIPPAKIAQNIGYDIYDIEFYNPGDAMQAMKKHLLLLRKNVIKLEMLPGPPRPLPPRHAPPPRFRPGGQNPMTMHVDMVPLGMKPGPPGIGSLSMPSMEHGPFPMGVDPRSMPHHPAPPHAIFGPPGIHPGPILPVMGPGQFVPMMVDVPNNAVIDPNQMPEPMRKKEVEDKHKKLLGTVAEGVMPEPQKEYIPVPPLPEDFSTYEVPAFRKDTPVGQGVITQMQGFFCQLCNKFYSSSKSAKVVHCKSKGHYDRLKQYLQEKKRLRKLAESEVIGT
ncbi:uncharacterized protein LOC120342122 isoform X2 [Styela clava]